MYYLKINNELYPAEFTGKMVDIDWDRRESKTIIFASGFTFATVSSLLADDVAWSIYETDDDYSHEYDNSEFSIRGDITLRADGRVSVKMGKPTELEEAYELLYGGM